MDTEHFELLNSSELNLLSSEKRFVKEEIREAIWQLDSYDAPDMDEFINIINFNKIYQVHFQKEDGDTITTIWSVDVYDVEELLTRNNVPHEKSNTSESVYLFDGTIRISTHKRPAYSHGAAYYDHQYEEEHIVRDEIELYYKTIEVLRGKGVDVIETHETIHR